MFYSPFRPDMARSPTLRTSTGTARRMEDQSCNKPKYDASSPAGRQEETGNGDQTARSGSREVISLFTALATIVAPVVAVFALRGLQQEVAIIVLVFLAPISLSSDQRISRNARDRKFCVVACESSGAIRLQANIAERPRERPQPGLSANYGSQIRGPEAGQYCQAVHAY